MIDSIKEFILENKLFDRKSKLLLAISGGADSVFLFFILKELGYYIEFAHCNFNLRGEESNQDEYFVRQLANRYSITCHVKSFEAKKYAESQNISIQMAARELRYNWFNDLLVTHNLHAVVTAHHRDDNIETFFINLIRGTGVDGLCGMKPKNNNIIRPLPHFVPICPNLSQFVPICPTLPQSDPI